VLWARVAVLAVAAAAFVAFRAPFLSLPLERDEGEYAYIAQRMLLGEVPYRDAFDQKPPGVFVAYLVAFSLFGQTVEGIHLFMYLWTIATCGLLFALVRRIVGPLAAAFSVLIFAVASADPRLTGNAANTEIFMVLPLVASLYGAIRAREADAGGAGWWCAAGALAALACWFKQVALSNALFVWLLALWGPGARSGGGWCDALRSSLALALGALLVLAPGLIAVAWVGAWRPFLDAVVLHNLDYSGRVSWLGGANALWFQTKIQAPSQGALWLLAGLGWLVAARRMRATAWLFGGWFAASAVGVATGLYFRTHYFIQALPALAALGGTFCGWAAMRWLGGARGAMALVGVAGLVLATVLPPWVANRPILRQRSTDAISRMVYGTPPFAESREIADFIERNSQPDDRVFIVGSEPQILFYARRRSASRYIFFYPLTGEFPDVLERQRQVADEVAANPPRFIVWANISNSFTAGTDFDAPLFSQIRAMLARGYRLELLAHPVAGKVRFEFLHGGAARRLMRGVGARARDARWIAVYRRRGAA